MGRRSLSAGGWSTGPTDNCTLQPPSHLALSWHSVKHLESWPATPEGLSFLLVTRGAGDFDAPGSTQQLAQGDVLVINGTAGDLTSSAPGEELMLGAFSLCFEQLFPLFGSGEVPALQAILEAFRGFKHYPASTAVAVQSHQLLREVVPAFNLCHRSQLLTIAAVALSEEFTLARNQRPVFLCPERHLAAALESLSVDQILTVPLRDLGPRFGCSRRHLNRLFLQCFGMSFADLRMELRLLKAASLLRDLNSKVIDVAEACGFHYLSLFNHCFKRRFGATPGRWREAKENSQPGTGCSLQRHPTCPMCEHGLCPWIAPPVFETGGVRHHGSVRRRYSARATV